MGVMREGAGETTVMIDRNQPTFYGVPPACYEAMLELIDDLRLAEVMRARRGEPAPSEWTLTICQDTRLRGYDEEGALQTHHDLIDGYRCAQPRRPYSSTKGASTKPVAPDFAKAYPGYQAGLPPCATGAPLMLYNR